MNPRVPSRVFELLDRVQLRAARATERLEALAAELDAIARDAAEAYALLAGGAP